jgi:regulator of PEP synthase PpsR (kinase-PPPase family)
VKTANIPMVPRPAARRASRPVKRPLVVRARGDPERIVPIRQKPDAQSQADDDPDYTDR